MILRCVRPFGNFAEGDEVEVPDGAAFDRTHFAEHEDREEAPDDAEEGK